MNFRERIALVLPNGTKRLLELWAFRARPAGVVLLTGYVLGTLGSALWCACSTASYGECFCWLVREIGDRNL